MRFMTPESQSFSNLKINNHKRFHTSRNKERETKSNVSELSIGDIMNSKSSGNLKEKERFNRHNVVNKSSVNLSSIKASLEDILKSQRSKSIYEISTSEEPYSNFFTYNSQCDRQKRSKHPIEKVYKISPKRSPVPELRFPFQLQNQSSMDDYINNLSVSRREKYFDFTSKDFSLEQLFINHKNSVNSIILAKNKLWSAGSDYLVSSWSLPGGNLSDPYSNILHN